MTITNDTPTFLKIAFDIFWERHGYHNNCITRHILYIDADNKIIMTDFQLLGSMLVWNRDILSINDLYCHLDE